MTSESIGLLDNILEGILALFGLLAALFALWARNERKHERVKAWISEKRETIQNSRWLAMPERVIGWIVHAKSAMVRQIIVRFFDKMGSNTFSRIYLSGIFLLLIIGCFIYWGIAPFVIAFAILALILPVVFISAVKNISLDIIEKAVRFIFALTSVTTVLVWTSIILRVNIVYSAPIMVAILPLYWLLLAFPALVILNYAIYNLDEDLVALIAMAIAASFSITLFALLAGHIASPAAYLPQTFQILMVNVICDGITMLVTFLLLQWAIKRNSLRRIPIAIALDLLIAGVLACASLYLALIGTDHALSPREVFNVLIIKSPDGATWEIGPYFWVMHTTFIPTILYLALILIAWIGKALLVPTDFIFRRFSEEKKPLIYAATLCTVIAAIFGVMTFLTGFWQDQVEKKERAAKEVACVDRHLGNDIEQKTILDARLRGHDR